MVNSKAQDAVQKSLDGAVGNKEDQVPGLVFTAVDKSGEVICENAAGMRGLNSKKPMDMDTVFWIASCTKLLGTICALQLVEQGKLSLDDSSILYKWCPELEKVQVLEEDGKLVPKKSEIALRQLLTHTSGFGYEFFNPRLRDYGRPIGFDCFGGTVRTFLDMPLVNQPGERFEYGIG